MLADLLHPHESPFFGLLIPFLVLLGVRCSVSVCRCFMGPSSAADAALFLEMVCGTVALARCLRFVVSMGPDSSAPAANGVLDLVFAFCWFRSIGPAVPTAALFFDIVCCNIARPWCLRLVSVVPTLPVFRSSMLLVSVRMTVCFTVSHLT